MEVIRLKRVAKPVFFVIAILILVLSYFATFGLHTQYGDIDSTVVKGIGDIRWGIDIRGGVEATFKPADGYDATDEEIESAKAVIETRLVSNNITDYELYADSSSDRIIVRFPWKETETEFDAKKAIDATFAAITEALVKGDKVPLVGFGTFAVSERAAREGRNPRTGETMKIEASKAPKFKAGKALKDAINE